MTETILHAESGRQTGSSASRRLRADDKIPGVVYGHGMEPLSISVARRDLRQAVSGSAGLNTIVDLTVDGEVYPSLIKDVQRHPVRLNIAHIDFIQVDLNEEITVTVPVHLTGEAKEVESNNGLIDQIMTELVVATTPRNIPDEIVFDVSEMDMDTTILVSDLSIPEGVRTVSDPDSAVVTVSIMRTPVLDAEAEAAEAAAEGEEGAEDAAEGGDSAADGASEE
ncbi:50S ribosomal protein L25 [Ilumatobacter coccineus]|uniref:Large ribosomal subunit protein bL25 n=1 Tax=Ilumatobacter coccineus (strain NBRC 103263 / KCTC 29153 / YM16-304) TaxID=1313172 RepID=A0A6C7E7H6_ILUCY|nr:50S ribosomal protein L25 [Ilumatobacter coccineus]BAN03624.1 50S ribosomal protein L25 [Ilumatobacter coccineus YM16-304]